jgi:hypothetical protein
MGIKPLTENNPDENLLQVMYFPHAIRVLLIHAGISLKTGFSMFTPFSEAKCILNTFA